MYGIKYLELFNKDLELTLKYISDVLCNESASRNLKDNVDDKIVEIRKNPYIFSDHIGMIPLKNNYKKAKVNNYYILFKIDEINNVIKVYRFLYAGSDLSKYT